MAEDVTPTNPVDNFIEVTIPGSLEQLHNDPSAKLFDIATLLNDDYPEDMIEVAKNIETNYVKRGKGYQIIYTVSTEQEKAILSDYIRDLADMAKDYYDDDVPEFSKSTLKRAEEAGNKAWEELFKFEPTITNTVPEEKLKKAPNDISTTDTPTNVVDRRIIKNLETELKNKYPDLEYLELEFNKIKGKENIYKQTDYFAGRDYIYLNSIDVFEDARGQGVGDKVMKELIAFADTNDIPILLDTRGGDLGLTKFYEKYGFLNTGSIFTSEQYTPTGSFTLKTAELIRQPGDLAGKATTIGEDGVHKNYEEAKKAAANSTGPMYTNEQLDDLRYMEAPSIAGLDTPTNVADDLDKLVYEYIKEIKTPGTNAYDKKNELDFIFKYYQSIGPLPDDSIYHNQIVSFLMEDVGLSMEEADKYLLDLVDKQSKDPNASKIGISIKEFEKIKNIDTPTNVVPESPIVFAPDITGEAYDEIEDLLLDLRDKYADVLDIGQDGDPALYFDVQPGITEEMKGVHINFELIEVSPKHQNKGIGTEILNEVKKIATKHKIPISATAADTSPTGFFAKQGFLSGEDMVWIPESIDPKYIVEKSGGSLGAAKLNDPFVFDSWIDNYANTTTSFVDNLPLSQTVKNRFDNLIRTRARNLATPGGVADAVDVWELGVLGLMIAAVAYKEYDEIPTIVTNKAVDMFNSMTSSYGIPPVPKEQYNLDYEFINKVVETGEKVMPTDIIIKKVGDVVKGAAETGAVTGFGYVPPNLTKTDTMETTQKIQPGVQEEKMFKQAKPKKSKATGGAGAKIL